MDLIGFLFLLMQGWECQVISINNSQWCKYHPCLPINMVLKFITMKINCLLTFLVGTTFPAFILLKSQ